MRSHPQRIRIVIVLAVMLIAAPVETWSQRPEAAKGQQRIEREVRHELAMLPFYRVFDYLTFQVQGSAVTLLGQVTLPTLKADAEAAVKRIEGVEKVMNQIEVLPSSPSNDRIRLNVYRAVYSEGALERYAFQAIPAIHIIVKGGHVTLEGVVARETDKNIANTRAKGVPGVLSVTNNLHVEKG